VSIFVGVTVGVGVGVGVPLGHTIYLKSSHPRLSITLTITALDPLKSLGNSKDTGAEITPVNTV
jgi:hypothetical protein